jgi:serine-type D-Ala-D-Ala endopeptidase (penicillin-binding protein 7)
MNFRKNHLHKAVHWAKVFTWVVAVSLATPTLSTAATAKKHTQAVNKSAASKPTDKKKPIASKVAVLDKASAATKASAKAPARDKRAANKPAAKSKQTQAKAQAPARTQSAAVTASQLRNVATHNTSAKPVAQQQASDNNSSSNQPIMSSKVAVGSGAAALLAHSVQGQATSAGEQQTQQEQQAFQQRNVALGLSSRVALVVDQDTHEVLFSKNDAAVLPIASLTKLMTGLVIADANLPMDEPITITQADVDTYKGSRSRLAVGTTLSRGELMHLALMSSENRAAHALGRTYPGGLKHFVGLMNAKARELGMHDTRYVEPTGLMSQNQSSARDLATLVSVAYERPILRDLSTSPGHQLALGHRTLQFNNSNRLIQNPEWEIGLQKTGYIAEAGRCLVMQAKVAGRKVIMVFLNSSGTVSRAQDAERMRRWVESQTIQAAFVRPQG